MSLINDALKKAQNRHGEPTPPSPSTAGPAAIPSAPRKGKTPAGKIALIGAGIALLSAAISATVILLVVGKDEPAPLPASPVTAPVAPAPAAETPLQPAASTPPAVSVPSPEPAAPAIKLGTRIQSFVDRLRVTSIRISDTGNKAILNDRLFRVGDLVEPSLGLRLTDIQPSQLTFNDESGNTYVRHF